MIGFLNLKSMTFYGGAIVAVIILFSLTTAYGESHLKATRKIGGRYRLVTPTLPGCLASQSLVLVVEQSGVYVTGALLSADAVEDAIKTVEERPPLIGQWNDRQLTFKGSIANLPGCRNGISLEATVNHDQLNGRIRLQSSSVSTPFAAQREESSAKAPLSH